MRHPKQLCSKMNINTIDNIEKAQQYISTTLLAQSEQPPQKNTTNQKVQGIFERIRTYFVSSKTPKVLENVVQLEQRFNGVVGRLSREDQQKLHQQEEAEVRVLLGRLNNIVKPCEDLNLNADGTPRRLWERVRDWFLGRPDPKDELVCRLKYIAQYHKPLVDINFNQKIWTALIRSLAKPDPAIFTPESIQVRDYPGDLDNNATSGLTKSLIATSAENEPNSTNAQTEEVILSLRDLFSEHPKTQDDAMSSGTAETLKIEFKDHLAMNVTIRQQDIFQSAAQVIVNAANSHLGGGGGIDGAIHRKGGTTYAAGHKALKDQYKGQYVLGHAVMIGSGNLNESGIDSVIVVAGPQGVTDKAKEGQLYSCYYNSLQLAESQGKESIAFPFISTGIFRFPKDRAAQIAMRAISDFITSHPNSKLKTISVHVLPDTKKNETLSDLFSFISNKSPSTDAQATT